MKAKGVQPDATSRTRTTPCRRMRAARGSTAQHGTARRSEARSFSLGEDAARMPPSTITLHTGSDIPTAAASARELHLCWGGSTDEGPVTSIRKGRGRHGRLCGCCEPAGAHAQDDDAAKAHIEFAGKLLHEACCRGSGAVSACLVPTAAASLKKQRGSQSKPREPRNSSWSGRCQSVPCNERGNDARLSAEGGVWVCARCVGVCARV